MPSPNQRPKHRMHTPGLTTLLAKKEVVDHYRIIEAQKKLIADHSKNRKKGLQNF